MSTDDHFPSEVSMPVASACPRCQAPLPDGVPSGTACPACGAPLSDLDTATIRQGDGARDSGTQIFPAPEPVASAGELRQLGQYRIVGKLGAGGMGEVYRAEDTALRRQVALKVMLPEFAAQPVARARFLREARAAAAVEHDHIIPIFNVGEDGGTAYLAMPLLKGESLADYLRARVSLPLPEALRIAREISDGLAAAHAAGLVHRDIKPANVWLEGDRRRVRILDFGLARPADGSDYPEDFALTKEGTVVGTPAYMSPEQGRSEPLDARSDLWSLGVVLYQMATGRLPFRGPTAMATLTAIAVDTPTAPGTLNPDIPPPLNDLILALLSKTPADRPATAGEVARRLADLEASLTAVALPADDAFAHLDDSTAATSLARPVERKRLPALVWLALGLLVVGGGATLTLITIRTPKGTLVIDTSDPDVEVVVKQDGAVIRDRTRDREIDLKVGEYTIELAEKKDGLRLNTNKFELTKNGKVVVRAYIEPKPAPVAKGPVDPTEPARWRDRLGATTEGLNAWATGLPKGFRVTALSARGGTTDVRFDAVAIYDPAVPARRLRADIPDEEGLADWNAQFEAGYQPEIVCPHPAGFATVWARGHRRWAKWHGDAADITDRIAQARSAGDWPLGLNARAGHYELVLDPAVWSARDWEAHLNLTADDLARQVDAARARGWRPHLLTAHATPGEARFAAVFADNRPAVDWAVTPNLTEAEYPTVKAERRAKGMHLRALTSILTGGVVRYTAAWETDPRPLETTAAARKAVEWVVSAGGAVGVMADGKDYLHVAQENAADLPTGPFALVNVSLDGVKAFNDAAVEHLRDLPFVRSSLYLTSTSVSGPGLAKLATYPGLAGLRYLNLNYVPVTDADLALVARFQALDSLGLRGTAITGAGLAELRGLRIGTLEANECAGLDDDGLRQLTAWPALRAVYAFDTKVTDAGVRKLERHPALTDLAVNGPGITDATADVLAGRPKTWRIHIGSSALTGDGLAKLKRLPALTELWITEGSAVPAAGFAVLAEFPALTSLSLAGSGGQVTDAALANLAGCVKLERLDLSGCQVTEGGVKRLAQTLPGSRIVWDGGTIEPTKK